MKQADKVAIISTFRVLFIFMFLGCVLVGQRGSIPTGVVTFPLIQQHEHSHSTLESMKILLIGVVEHEHHHAHVNETQHSQSGEDTENHTHTSSPTVAIDILTSKEFQFSKSHLIESQYFLQMSPNFNLDYQREIFRPPIS